jgi:hypothetical protein
MTMNEDRLNEIEAALNEVGDYDSPPEVVMAGWGLELVAEVRRLRTEITALADSGDRMHGKVRTSALRALLADPGDSHTHAHTGGDEEPV